MSEHFHHIVISCCGKRGSLSKSCALKRPDACRNGLSYTPNKRRAYVEDYPESSCNYGAIIVLSSILLVGELALTVFWLLRYRGGFDWTSNPLLQFNLHPLFMTAGFVTFSGFSILMYRICRCCYRNVCVKSLDILFYACTVFCAVIGFIAVWNSKELGAPKFHSIHSWLGLITMGLLVLQFLVGFLSFLVLCYKDASSSICCRLVSVQNSFGLATFVLACSTGVTGLTEKTISGLGSNYSNCKDERIIINSIGLSLAALILLVSYAIRSNANAKVYMIESL